MDLVKQKCNLSSLIIKRALFLRKVLHLLHLAFHMPGKVDHRFT